MSGIRHPLAAAAAISVATHAALLAGSYPWRERAGPGRPVSVELASGNGRESPSRRDYIAQNGHPGRSSLGSKTLTAPPASQTAPTAEVVSPYLATLSDRIHSALRGRFPPGLRAHPGRRLEAWVAFTVEADGAPAALALEKGSGDSEADALALAALREASPFPPPPGGQALRLRVPVVFQTRRSTP